MQVAFQQCVEMQRHFSADKDLYSLRLWSPQWSCIVVRAEP